ncbi:MAG: hypothetical protein JWO13_915 [Acidobacteriales bacterium]|nr:hypothetical protein [Terriglobales bacterium]
MTKRIAALAFIFICTTVAWMILGSTIFARTYSLEPGLKSKLASTWGAPQEQLPPSASYDHVTTVEAWDDRTHTLKRELKTNQVPLGLQSTRIDVKLDLEHRQKGLLWYSTYTVQFAGDYDFTNYSNEEQLVSFKLTFPAEQAVYGDMFMSADGQPIAFVNQGNGVVGSAHVPAGKVVRLRTGYISHGLDSWHYKFGENVSQIRDFTLVMHTNFPDIDFPDNTLSPTKKAQTTKGWDLTWNYKALVSGFQIGMAMPEKLQPGPLAGQISYFAPVSLFFFFFIMFIITAIRGIDLHPMNYFFLAGAFFAFHLLMAYLVDHISIHVAFVICSIVSIFLVVSYLRLVVGIRFAAVEAGLAQLVYLVLFSYAFFFKGFTGLAITIGSILTLFVVMQMTGRIRWEEKFARFNSSTNVPA